MAGSYPDYLYHRMPYDQDGTRVYTYDGSLVARNQAQNEELNDEDSTGASAADRVKDWIFLFPEIREIQGLLVLTDGGGTFDVSVSTDTTDGLDGTWSTPETYDTAAATGTPYRDNIEYDPIGGACGLKLTDIGASVSTSGLIAVHIFYEDSLLEFPDALALWDPNTEARLDPAALDWGTVPQNSSDDATFRVMNLSSVLTAKDVAVSLDALVDTSPSVPAQHLLSSDGSIFTASLSVGDLGPRAASTLLTIRRATASSAALGDWTFRLNVRATSWDAGTWRQATPV